jgi:hypothetical protein
MFIPRIPVIPPGYLLSFKRMLFPLRSRLGKITHKSPEQSVKILGFHLRNPSFAHRQLYVGYGQCEMNESTERLYFIVTIKKIMIRLVKMNEEQNR